MKSCDFCGIPMAEADKFCGGCGKPAGKAASPSPEPALPPEVAAAGVAASPHWPSGKAIQAIALGAGAVGLIGLLLYFAPWDFGRRQEPPPAPVKAVLAEGKAPASSRTPQPKAAPTATETPARKTDQDKSAPSASQAAAEPAPPIIPEMIIEPGRWRFMHEVVEITAADPNDNSFMVDRSGVGVRGGNERCIPPEFAQAPRRYGFPLPPQWNCGARSGTMANGRYRARFHCVFPKPARAGEVTVNGSFTSRDVHVMVSSRQPGTNPKAGPYDQLPDIVLHTRIDGAYLGPCG